jgi:O-antigen/teichoic acid export membrane protein
MFWNDFAAMSFANALRWSFLSELAAKIVAPLVFIILARLLAPEDFGVIAAAMVVISFSQIFWEAGMGKAIIQYQGDRATAANAAFWINGALALAVAAILVAVAGAVADRVFHDERVALVLQVMALQVVLSAAVSVHTALLQKDMQFKPLFWVRLATVAIPGLISIPLALYGMGYWALIAGTLIGQFVQVVMLWRMSEWRPEWSFNAAVARELGGFGAWVAVSGLLAWFYVWADALIVGIYLGSHELGLYRTGNQFAMMIFAILFGPIVPVLYSHLSTMKQDRERLGKAIEKVIRVIILFAVPLALIVFSLADPIAAALFGNKWQGIGLIIGVMALMHGFSWVVGMNGEVYRAMGKPAYEAIVTSATLVIYLSAYLISIQQGFEVFVWTRLTLAMVALSLHLFVLRKVVPVTLTSIARYLLKITLISAFVVTSVHFFLSQNLPSGWWQLTIGGVFNFVLVGMAIFVIERRGVLREVTDLVRMTKP